MERRQTLTPDELTRSLCQYARTVYTAPAWHAWLTVSARFHAFSLANILLLCAQKPDAVHVGGYHYWQEEFGRYVRRGEKGIRLVFPAYGDESFSTASVFDVSQTDGGPLPAFLSFPGRPASDDPLFLQALLLASPVPVRFEKTAAGVNGFYRALDREIIIREGMAAAETQAVLLKEISCALVMGQSGRDCRTDRIRREIETAAVAAIVSRRFRLHTHDGMFRHIAAWAEERSPQELTASLETIRMTADHLIRLIQTVRDPLGPGEYPDPLSLICC